MAGSGPWINGLPETKEAIKQLADADYSGNGSARISPEPTSESPNALFYTVSDNTGQSPDSIFPTDLFSG
jgi:hypothetical protein